MKTEWNYLPSTISEFESKIISLIEDYETEGVFRDSFYGKLMGRVNMDQLQKFHALAKDQDLTTDLLDRVMEASVAMTILDTVVQTPARVTAPTLIATFHTPNFTY
ncbi:unnamed protein product [Vicia faba]|uniref:Uncharacterized protein n=1 Tax=Vicia faba TaxID=3906 RepID=A0AAV1B6X7_VICFA|nr:unnamed protein product [Vicia faba]